MGTTTPRLRTNLTQKNTSVHENLDGGIMNVARDEEVEDVWIGCLPCDLAYGFHEPHVGVFHPVHLRWRELRLGVGPHDYEIQGPVREPSANENVIHF